MTRGGIATVLAIMAIAHAVHASPALLAGTGEAAPVSEATEVVVLRKGTQTVITLRPSYKGAGEPFALVIPVPAGVTERDIKVLAPDAVNVVDTLGAPRVVEYDETNPCKVDTHAQQGSNEGSAGGSATGSAAGSAQPAAPAPAAASKPAPIAVSDTQLGNGEYQISVVAAKDAGALADALRAYHLSLPPGSDAALQAYIAAGMKLVIARVEPSKLHLDGGRALLSPLRIHYVADRLVVPLRAGVANSPGMQDLIVNVLAPHQRYQAASYPNITIATNLTVRSELRDRVTEVYAALLDATLAKHPGAVVTEYAWDATTCEPCTGSALDGPELAALGDGLLALDAATPQPYQNEAFVLTRLHLRYAASITRDLELVPAPPIAGGREQLAGDGALEQGPHASTYNAFQARYAIRSPWLGPIVCDKPARSTWEPRPGTATAVIGDAFARRGAIKILDAVTSDILELDLRASGSQTGRPQLAISGRRAGEAGCGCQTSDDSRGPLALAIALTAIVRRRRRRR